MIQERILEPENSSKASVPRRHEVSPRDEIFQNAFLSRSRSVQIIISSRFKKNRRLSTFFWHNKSRLWRTVVIRFELDDYSGRNVYFQGTPAASRFTD